MLRWQDILHFEFLGNPVMNWGLAVVTFLVTLTVLPIIKGFIAARRRSWTPDDRLQFHSAIELTTLLVARTSRAFLFAVALYLASRHLTFPPRLERVITIVIVCVFWLQVGLWAMAAVRFGIERRRARSAGLDAVLAGSMDVILFCAGLIIWAMVLLLALDNLGIQIKPLLAGLGIGGIAIALSVQTLLGDLLASMSITLDKPFSVGDSLTIGDFQGTVEHIGVRSTKLRSLSGEQIIIANADIVKARVRNFGRMGDRRAVFPFGVSYDTPTDVLAAIPGEVRKIVEAQRDTRFDRCHFLTYGDTALQFELVYFVTKPDFGMYADTQQAINLALLDRLRAMKVQLAAPTRALVYVELPAGSAKSG
ncbi:MAG TPA: mechanosensitive ion channel family protein [Steroidobacteraceae bacterium]|nr:mechanosensitive ion channel family protein [Steroidobacteraceae bacterium]